MERSPGCPPAAALVLLAALAPGPAAVADELEAPPPLELERPLRVVIDEAYPPHQFADDQGNPTGFDVELFEAVAESVGLDYAFELASWPEIRAGLIDGSIDVNPGVFKTPMRSRALDFTAPTVWLRHTIFVRDDSSTSRLEDLAGKEILLNRDGLHDERHRETPFPIVPVLAADAAAAMRRLAAGEADAAVVLDVQGLYFARRDSIENVRSIGKPLGQEALRFAVPEDRQELLELLNDGLAAVRLDGRYDELYDRWFGVIQPEGVPTERAALLVAGALGVPLLLLALALLWARLLRRQVAARTRDLESAQREQQALERSLHQARKLEMLGRLAGSVAHDFNNLLTSILGNVEIARDRREGESLDDSLDQIETAGESAAHLTRRLLALSRSRAVKPVRTSWNDVVLELFEMLRRLLPPSIELRHELEPNPPAFTIDPGEASQVVLNLVLNARDAVGQRGEITIRTEHRPSGDGGLIAVLRVRDDGTGMDAETRAQVFEPFFTRKGEAGSGLGLATVHDVATHNGGTVEVESEPGVGTEFRVLLPATPARLDAAADETRAHVTHAEGAERILFVDDDAGVRRIVARMLESLGHEVQTEADAPAALASIQRRPPDLLIVDLVLPGISGTELARRVRARWPDVRILYTSGYAPEEVEIPSADAGPIYFLAKPIQRDRLAVALRSTSPGGAPPAA